MVSKTTVIKNPSGLHLRPAGVLCKEALRYKSKISFKCAPPRQCQKRPQCAWRCVKSGDEITFVCEGPDEKEALAAMVKIVEDGLGE